MRDRDPPAEPGRPERFPPLQLPDHRGASPIAKAEGTHQLGQSLVPRPGEQREPEGRGLEEIADPHDRET
jgi:hypothetical protein